MKAFITGISGFVGAGLAHKMLKEGHEVHGLVRPTSNLWRLKGIQDKLHLHYGDLLDKTSVVKALDDAKPDAVFHLAVYGAYPNKQKDKDLIIKSSLLSTIDLLDAAKNAGVKIVINTGSSSEYGTKDVPMREDMFIEPNSYYAVGKAAQTLYCQQFAHEEKLPVITLRLFSVYGPHEEPGRLVPNLITKALRHEQIPLANPKIARDFIYIDDVAEAYLLAADRPDLSGHVFNVGSGVQSTLQDAFDAVIEQTQSSSQAQTGAYESRSFDTNIWVADMSKSRDVLKFTPKYSLKDGLKDTILWMRDNLDEYQK